jgi:hypothetical protein
MKEIADFTYFTKIKPSTNPSCKKFHQETSTSSPPRVLANRAKISDPIFLCEENELCKNNWQGLLFIRDLANIICP